jgi:DNA (cytosine-5)-methyltransferase 1
MGYGDDFNIVCSNTQTYKQVGNSIVVDVIGAVLNNIIKALEV